MRIFLATLVAFSGFAFFAGSSQADVIIRGPFGGTIVVASPADVRVGPGVMVGSPARPPSYYRGPAYATNEAPIVSTSKPVARPEAEGETLPPPKVLRPGMGTVPPTQPGIVVNPVPPPVALAILPRDLAKTFKPGPEPASYEVLFLHPVSRQPVKVCFDLPPGCPRVSYCLGSLVMDYGRHEVEIRFKLGGSVVVTQR
jgi:hypothetical protein